MQISDTLFMVHRFYGGIGKLEVNSGIFSIIVPGDSIEERSVGPYFPYIDDKNENFYYVTCGNIYKVNYKKFNYNIIDIKKEDFQCSSVTSLAFDKKKNLWIGTDDGLSSFNIISKKIYRYTTKDGLPTNETERILFVKDALWVTYPNGIYKFTPPQNQEDKLQKPIIRIYDSKNGLPNVDYSTRVMIHRREGSILFNADTLLISFFPDSIKSNEYIPPVIITSLQVNNKNIEAGDSNKILANNIISIDTLHLKYNQNNLSFEFAALNYIHSEYNEYAYTMQGIDTGWVYCGKRRFVNYSNLKPGEYKFKVKASNNDGLWNEKGTFISIFIKPPWWQTWWAYLLYVITFITAIILIIRFRTASLKRKQKLLEAKVKERTEQLKYTQTKLLQKENAELLQKVSAIEMKALRSQMNPHFIFNALQSIQTFLVKHQPDEANKYLIKFSKLMRAVLENSQRSEVLLKDDIQALELYMQLESIRLTNPFTYSFHIDGTVDIESDTIPPLILQPFVENAIWHGLQYKQEAGHIDVYLFKKNNALYVTVEDNGVGRKMSKEFEEPVLLKKESLGMKLTEERLKILNELKKIKAQFQITDLFTPTNQPAGTRVELSLPFEA